MALTVLVALYPTVMFLAIFLAPHTKGLGLAGSMLVGNAASVAMLEWLIMPVVRRILGPWLRGNENTDRALSLRGMVLIVVALAVMTFLFTLVT